MIVLEWNNLKRGINDLSKRISLTIGVFDGLHRGHTYLISKTIHNHFNALPAVITFKNNPRKALSPEKHLGEIMDLDTKLKMLHEMGVKIAVLIDFSSEFRSYSGKEFIKHVINGLPVVHMVLGENFKCGKDLDTDAFNISNMLKKHNITVDIVNILSCGNTVVSSTNIRKAILEGHIDHANHMLGRKYSVSLRNTLFSIHENNVIVQRQVLEQLIPESGVYAVEIDCNEGTIPALATINADTVTISMDADNNINMKNIIFNYREKGEKNVVNKRGENTDCN